MRIGRIHQAADLLTLRGRLVLQIFIGNAEIYDARLEFIHVPHRPVQRDGFGAIASGSVQFCVMSWGLFLIAVWEFILFEHQLWNGAVLYLLAINVTRFIGFIYLGRKKRAFRKHLLESFLVQVLVALYVVRQVPDDLYQNLWVFLVRLGSLHDLLHVVEDLSLEIFAVGARFAIDFLLTELLALIHIVH